MAERQIREAEERVARQIAVVEGLERAGHAWAAAEAEKMLATARASLDLARGHRALARLLPGGGSDA